MPSIYTHYKFGKDVLNKLDKKSQKLINKEIDYYNLFNQSFDTLYYYNFLSLNKGSEIRNFAHYAHKNNTNVFFINLINYIIDNNLKNDSTIMNFLYGFINHYVLDTTLHPFLNYKTGRYNKLDRNTDKYKGLHTLCEITIDKYYYELDKKNNWYTYKIYKDFLKNLSFPKVLQDMINNVFMTTFNKQNMGLIFEKSNKQSINIYKYLMYDRYGIKKIMYHFIDIFTPFKSSLYASYSFHVPEINSNLLNNLNHFWCNPCDKDIFYEYSLDELYSISLKESVSLIKQVNKVLFNEDNLDNFINILGNKNYETGLDIKDKKRMEFFEF